MVHPIQTFATLKSPAGGDLTLSPRLAAAGITGAGAGGGGGARLRRAPWLWHLANFPRWIGSGGIGGPALEVHSKETDRTSRRQPGRHAAPAGEDYHIPVMLEEAAHFLAPGRGKLILDATLGGGGHTQRLLEEGANVIGLDRDADALEFVRHRLSGYRESFSAIQANFRDFGELLTTVGLQTGLDGILLDLGVSSRQLENPERGFSFQHDGPLDMRMDTSRGETAAELVNERAPEELEKIFREYGEERAARRIAARIVRERERKRIVTTRQLADVVESVQPRRGRQHPATRVFQALRVAVNDELGALHQALEQTHEWLRPGGRLVVITFHSLEDRIVKRFMRRACQEWIDRPELPEPVRNPECHFTPVMRKALAPSQEEIGENPRARTAKMRIVERRKVNEKAAK